MVPIRSIGRPLTSAPQSRHALPGHPGQVRRAAQPGRQHLQPSVGDRRPASPAHRQMHLHRVSQREVVRRRRANVLFVLAITVGISAFLAATTKAEVMVYVFALSFMSLCGYCYKLVQLRNDELDRTYGDQHWFNAA